MRLVDSHAHLQSDRFGGDVDHVLDVARAAGVERILVPGWNRASSEDALALVSRYPWLDAAVGIHPHDATAAEADWAWVDAVAREDRVVAIGETGLDFDRLFSPRDVQLTNLRRHLDLALEVAKPPILHCRSATGQSDAQEALVAELQRAGYGTRPAAPPIIHSFSGSAEHGRTLISMGCVISFSGLVFRAGEEASADVAALASPDRLLVETDSPYLSPPGAPRRRNEPAYVAITGAWLAERRSTPPDAVGDQLVAAYDRAFPRVSPR